MTEIVQTLRLLATEVQMMNLRIKIIMWGVLLSVIIASSGGCNHA